MNTVSGSADDFERPDSVIPVECNSPEAIVRFLVGELVHTSQLAADDIEVVIEQVLRRESLGSTAVGLSRAFPEAKLDSIPKPIVAVGRCARPVKWPGSPDGALVNTVCLLLAPTQASLLAALETASRRLVGD